MEARCHIEHQSIKNSICPIVYFELRMKQSKNCHLEIDPRCVGEATVADTGEAMCRLPLPKKLNKIPSST